MARIEIFMIAEELMQEKKSGRNEENQEPVERDGRKAKQTSGAKSRHNKSKTKILY